MSKRSRACDIKPKAKEAVRQRDGGRCVICRQPGLPNAHFIARSHGGLGIEQNVVTLCPACHMAYDNGAKKEEYKDRIREYLRSRYRDWSEKDLIYDKWKEVKT